MSNRFRAELEEEEGKLLVSPVKEEEGSGRFFVGLFVGGGVSKEVASAMLPFVIYLAFLGMIYIGNRHFAEKNIRSIDKLSKEVKELSWDYKTLKADLMLKSTQTELAKQVDTLGLKEPVEPPKKIVVPADEYQD